VTERDVTKFEFKNNILLQSLSWPKPVHYIPTDKINVSICDRWFSISCILGLKGCKEAKTRMFILTVRLQKPILMLQLITTGFSHTTSVMLWSSATICIRDKCNSWMYSVRNEIHLSSAIQYIFTRSLTL